MNALIAQNPSNPPAIPGPNSNFLDWGIAIAVLMFIVREAVSFFKKKDEEDSQLTNTLIQDLRNTNQGLLQKQIDILVELRESQENESGSLTRMEKAIREMMVQYQAEAQVQKRDSTLMLVEVREQLTVIRLQLDALHKRLDKASIDRNE